MDFQPDLGHARRAMNTTDGKANTPAQRRRCVVIGDVHGCLDECKSLLTQCGFDWQSKLDQKTPPRQINDATKPHPISASDQHIPSFHDLHRVYNAPDMPSSALDEPEVVFVGDLVAKGPKSIEMVDFVRRIGKKSCMVFTSYC